MLGYYYKPTGYTMQHNEFKQALHGSQDTTAAWSVWLKGHWFTSLIVLICLAVYLLFQIAPEFSYLLFLTQLGEAGSSLYVSLFTASLSHIDLFHLVMNVSAWLIMASRIERFNRLDLALLFLVAGLAGNVAQYIVSGGNFLGLSGVAYGLVGYVAWLQVLRKSVFFYIPNSFVYFSLAAMIVFLVTPFFDSIANAAHIAGFIAGAALGAMRELLLPGRQ